MDPRVLIIGCGFAGLSAGQALRKVTVPDRTHHYPFTPLLYQVAIAALSAPSIAGPIRHILSAMSALGRKLTLASSSPAS